MSSDGLDNYLFEFYEDEITDQEFYLRLSRRIGSEQARQDLIRLSEIEKEHAEYWKNKIIASGGSVDRIHYRKWRVRIYLFLFRILGLNLTVNLLERGEIESIISYREYLKITKDEDTIKGLRKIIEDEVSHEKLFDDMSPSKEVALEHIRAFIYGVSDGVVEVLAAIAGLYGILSSNFLVALGGFVVAIGGTISMSLGAYLSRSSESDYKITTIKKKSVIDDHLGDSKLKAIQEESGKSKKSALNTGLSYIFGAIFPIAPFLFPLGIFSLIIAIVLVVIVQGVSNAIVAVALNTPILKSASRAAVLSLLAAIITYVVGLIFHTYFNIAIA